VNKDETYNSLEKQIGDIVNEWTKNGVPSINDVVRVVSAIEVALNAVSSTILGLSGSVKLLNRRVSTLEERVNRLSGQG
jgi:hypothetical protein